MESLCTGDGEQAGTGSMNCKAPWQEAEVSSEAAIFLQASMRRQQGGSALCTPGACHIHASDHAAKKPPCDFTLGLGQLTEDRTLP